MTLGGCLELGEHLALGICIDRDEQSLLGFVVVVDGAGGDVGSCSDVFQRGRVVAVS